MPRERLSMTVLERLKSAAPNGEAHETAAFLAGFLPLGRPVVLTEEMIEAARRHDAAALAALLAEEVQPELDEVEALRELDEHPELGETIPFENLKAELGL